MAYNVKCPKCQKRYAAEDRLVGKRIRCRQCGTVFPVLAADEIDAAVRSPKPATVAAASDPFADETALPTNRAGRTSAGTELAHDNLLDDEPPKAALPKTARRRAGFHRHRNGARVVRPRQPAAAIPGQPLARKMGPAAASPAHDRLGGPGELRRRSQRNALGPIVRLLLVAAIYLGVAVPLTLQAAYVALRTYRYAPPPKPYWRIAVIFCLPAVLGFVLWMVSSSALSFIGGCAVGVALAFLVYWLLFRQDWGHAGASYAIAGGTFMASALLGMALMMGTNFALNQLLIASHHANSFVRSPLGDDLAWTVPPAPRQPAVPMAQATDNTSTVDHSAKSPQSSPPPNAAASNAQTSTDSGHSADSASQSASSDSGNAAEPTTPRTGDPGPGRLFTSNDGAADSVVARIKAAKIPWVAAVSGCDETSNERFLLQLTPSRFIGILRRQASGAAEIECCGLDPFVRVGAVPLIDPPADDSSGLCGYVISTDGKQLLRLADFPSQQIEVRSFARPGEIDKVPLTIATTFSDSSPVPDRTFTPQLLGALPGHEALIRWTRPRGDVEILEVWDCRQKTIKLRRLAHPSAGGHTIGNFAVSPDGKWFASTAPSATAHRPRCGCTAWPAPTPRSASRSRRSMPSAGRSSRPASPSRPIQRASPCCSSMTPRGSS